MTETKPMHLPDLYIEGFRGIDKLTIPRLGRVTLLAGKNGVGKSTVLDAVRVYAARGDHPTLRELLAGREELSFDDGGDERVSVPDVEALFYGRDISRNGSLSIGPISTVDQLRISIASHDDLWGFLQERQRLPSPELWIAEGRHGVKVTFQRESKICPLGFPFRVPTRNRYNSSVQGIKCESTGPGILTNHDLAWFWDNVALTDDERVAVDSLNLLTVGDSVIGIHAPEAGRSGRQIMVRLKSHRRPVPLRSLGDGAMRIFGVALALANSRDGFLLIDEAENGIHHTLQRNFWRMVLQTAQASNVQVLATTHSWDCVVGFSRAAIECKDAEGILYRLSRRYGDLRAVDYPENELKIAAEHGIEVR